MQIVYEGYNQRHNHVKQEKTSITNNYFFFWYHGCRTWDIWPRISEDIKILVKLLFLFCIIEFKMMKFLTILQIKTGKFVIKVPHSAR